MAERRERRCPCRVSMHNRRNRTMARDLETWYATDSARPRIGLLGQLFARCGGDPDRRLSRLQAELVVYLYARLERGARSDEIENALWGGRPTGGATVRAVLSKTRRLLGACPCGQPWLPRRNCDGRYRLRAGVLVDLDLFCRLREGGSGGDLCAALGLVRGIPLDHADDTTRYRRPFTWLASTEIHPGLIVAVINDTAHDLAELLARLGRYGEVAWAVRQAWLADPDRGFEQLWLDLISAEAKAGHLAGERQLFLDFLRSQELLVAEDLSPATYRRILELIPDLIPDAGRIHTSREGILLNGQHHRAPVQRTGSVGAIGDARHRHDRGRHLAEL
jgi:hypothetical protein